MGVWSRDMDQGFPLPSFAFYPDPVDDPGYRLTAWHPSIRHPGTNTMWSDGTTAWIYDIGTGVFWAYNLADGSRSQGHEIDARTDSEFDAIDILELGGVWSDGTHLWFVETWSCVVSRHWLTTNEAGDWAAGVPTDLPDGDDAFVVPEESVCDVYDRHDGSLDSTNESRPWPIDMWSNGTDLWVTGYDYVYVMDMVGASTDANFVFDETTEVVEEDTSDNSGMTAGLPRFGRDGAGVLLSAKELGSISLQAVAPDSRPVGVPIRAVNIDGDNLEYSLGGTDAGSFEIDADTGQLYAKATTIFDHETKPEYELVVTVTETSTSVTDTINVTIRVNDVDEPATAQSGELTAEHAENSTASVGQYVVADPEEATEVWSTSGPDARRFTAASGALRFVDPPNFEKPADVGGDNTYQVTVMAVVGVDTITWDVMVTVTPVDEAPAVSGPSAKSLNENSTNLVIGDYTAEDPEGQDVTWMSLGGVDAAQFNFDSTTGRLELQSVPDHEAPTDVGRDNVYNVVLRALGGSRIGDLAVTVTVVDVDEDPVVDGLETVSRAENTQNLEINYYGLDDPEERLLTWLALRGADAGDFTFDPISGLLSFKDVPDFEAPTDSGRDNVYNVVVRASDGSRTGKLDVEVTVTPVDEPGVVSLSSLSPVIGTQLVARLSDPDGATAVMWSWETSGTDPITGATPSGATSRYTPKDSDVGSTLTAIATYTDGHDDMEDEARKAATQTVVAPEPTNSDPMFSETAPMRDVDENTGPDQLVGEPVEAVDNDADDALTYALSGNDAAAFDIDSSGQITTRAALDHEAKSSYRLTGHRNGPLRRERFVDGDRDRQRRQREAVAVGSLRRGRLPREQHLRRGRVHRHRSRGRHDRNTSG